MQDGLAAGREVGEGAVGLGAVTAAAALGEQGHQVDECQAEAAQDDVFAGSQCEEVRVGGELGREVEAAVPAGEGGVVTVLGGGSGAEVSLGEDDQVGGERSGTVGEVHLLRAVRGAGDGGRGGGVPLDRDGGRQLGQRPAEHPVQVGALGAAGGEVGPAEGAQFGEHLRVGGWWRYPLAERSRELGGVRGVARAPAGELGGPLRERGARLYRAVDGGRLVGEHGDVLGHGVHPQQRGLPVAPDATRARRVRIHQVNVQLP